MTDSDHGHRRVGRTILLSLCLLGAALATFPMAQAWTCRWDVVGPLYFECSGSGGCVYGVGPTPDGKGVFVGCMAWDK